MNENEIHKTTINIPIDLYIELKSESKALGINFNALLLVKLQQLQKQNDTLKLLEQAVQLINENKNK